MIGEYWIVINGIAPDGGLYGPKVCTEAFSSFTTALFEILVLPEKITFSIKRDAPIADVAEKICLFADKMNGPVFSGLGLNFIYQLNDEADRVADVTRARFAAKQMDPMIDTPETVWGTTAISPSLHGSVMRLQVMPGFADSDKSSPPNSLIADFNFHFNITSASDVRRILTSHFTSFSDHACLLQSKITNAPVVRE